METLSEDEITILKEIFILIAKDDDVGIRTKDLRLALKSLGYTPTEAECQDLINLINEDDPHDKMILYFSRLLSLMSTKSDDIDEDQALKEVFEVFDKDQSGCINATELRRVMVSVGGNVSEEDASEMIQILKPVEDEEEIEGIDYKQFLLLLSK